MGNRRSVILVTDGDDYARRSIEYVAKAVGGRCISLSHGNPTKLNGPQIVKLIKKASHDPVIVMFDDSGYEGEGAGERALKYVATHPDIVVLGILAVAAKTRQAEWARVNVCIDRDGELTPYGVDKYGVPEMEIGRLYGDTVYCLDELKVPIIVGIGDIGKMSKMDDLDKGSPITRKAIEFILERSGYHVRQQDAE